MNRIEFSFSTGLTTTSELTTAEVAAILIIPLSQRQDAAWARIKAERDRREQNGGYLVGVTWFHSDVESKIKYLGLVLLGANTPVGAVFTTMAGATVPVTQALVSQILAAAATRETALYNAAITHQTAMMASLTPETYTFATGWPAIFA